MKLMKDEVVELSGAIVKQAVDDYRELKRRNRTSGGNRNVGRFSLEEVEEFFQSEYCEALIQDGLKFGLTGLDFLRAAT